MATGDALRVLMLQAIHARPRMRTLEWLCCMLCEQREPVARAAVEALAAGGYLMERRLLEGHHLAVSEHGRRCAEAGRMLPPLPALTPRNAPGPPPLLAATKEPAMPDKPAPTPKRRLNAVARRQADAETLTAFLRDKGPHSAAAAGKALDWSNGRAYRVRDHAVAAGLVAIGKGIGKTSHLVALESPDPGSTHPKGPDQRSAPQRAEVRSPHRGSTAPPPPPSKAPRSVPGTSTTTTATDRAALHARRAELVAERAAALIALIEVDARITAVESAIARGSWT